MAERDTWEGFTRLVLDEARYQIQRMDPLNNEEVAEAVHNHLFDRDGPIAATSGKVTNDQQHFWKVFGGFTEINTCIERLRDIEAYIGSFRYRAKRLNRINHIRYHVENYFNEIYILRERLNTWLKRIERAFKNDRRSGEMRPKLEVLRSICNETLQGVSGTRSSHVHQARFDSRNLSRLDLLDLVSRNGSDNEFLTLYYEVQYRAIRLEWQLQMKSNNEAIEKLLNIVASTLTPLIFNKRRHRMRYPRANAA